MNNDGAVNGLFGRFPSGLTSEESMAPAKAIAAVGMFLTKNRSQLVPGSVPFEFHLSGSDLRVIDKQTHVVFMRQTVAGYDVLDGELTALFWPSGELRAFTGPLAIGPEQMAPNLDEAKAREIAQGLLASVQLNEGSEVAQPHDDSVASLGYSVQVRGLAWLVESGPDEIWIDDVTGEIFWAGSKIDSGADSFFGDCTVRHRDLVRNGSGNATSLSEASSATLIDTLQCGGDDWFGIYYWHLKRQNTYLNTSYKHEIGRVQDANGGQAEIVTANPSLVPTFTATNGDSLREQGAFYVQTDMRYFINDNMWSNIIYSTEYNVHMKMDDEGVATAEFNDFTREIRCNSTTGLCTGGNCCRQDVLAHEYGHYVVDTYGDVSNNCTAGTDEGDSIDETLANVHGELFYLDDAQTLATYGALDGFGDGNAPPAHTSPGSIRAAAATCPGPNNPGDGLPFEQAMWELFWNRNCSLETCASTDVVDGNTILPGLSSETVMNQFGTALAFAQDTLGQNVTFGMVRASIRSKIFTDQGSAAATATQRVFSHHGLTCPSCCTGC